MEFAFQKSKSTRTPTNYGNSVVSVLASTRSYDCPGILSPVDVTADSEITVGPTQTLKRGDSGATNTPGVTSVAITEMQGYSIFLHVIKPTNKAPVVRPPWFSCGGGTIEAGKGVKNSDIYVSDSASKLVSLLSLTIKSSGNAKHCQDRRWVFSLSTFKASFTGGKLNVRETDLDSAKARSIKATSDCTKESIRDE